MPTTAAARTARSAGRSGGRATGKRQGFLERLGPGLITGVSDADPSGIGTYSQAGSQYGYSLLWTALFTYPLMAAVQEMCGRIALQSGEGLAENLKRRFPLWLVGGAVASMLVANIFNLGADLAAVAGGISLLTHDRVAPAVCILPVAVLITAGEVFLPYSSIFRVLKYLTLAMFAYFITVVAVHPPLGTVLRNTLIPHVEWTKDFVGIVVAILGTTITPYLFFWQASAEVDAERTAGRLGAERRRGVARRTLTDARQDILAGTGLGQLMMFAILLTSAAVLNANGVTDVQSAADAAKALEPAAGSLAFLLFGVGIIATGLLAIPVLAGSATYAVTETLGWGGSLADTWRRRPAFYAVIVGAMAAGAALNLAGIDPIKGLLLAAVVNGVVAGPLLVLITIVGCSRAQMGQQRSGPLSRTLCWAAAIVMCLAAVALIVTLL